MRNEMSFGEVFGIIWLFALMWVANSGTAQAPWFALFAAFSLFSLGAFIRPALRMPERIGSLGFLGYLGCLGFIPGMAVLHFMFGFSGLFGFFGFLGRRVNNP